MHGQGRLISQNGRLTECDWVDGKMNGETTIQYPNGDLFMGEVIDNEMQGEGKQAINVI